MTNKDLIDFCNLHWGITKRIFPNNPCIGCVNKKICDNFWLKYRDTPYKNEYSKLYSDEEIPV